MQLLIIALALGIFVHDGLPAEAAAVLSPAGQLAVFILPKVALAGVYGLCCWYVVSRLGTAGGGALVRRLDRFTAAYRWLALGLYGLDLYAGILQGLRERIGNLVLIDELLIMLPTLAMIVWAWWAYYPIDRRLREAGLIRQIDSGGPVYPLWTRWQFLLAQVRHQLLLIFAPLVLIMGWSEAVQRYAPVAWEPIGDPRPALVGLGAVGVFLLAPVMLRYLWDTERLPAGEVRNSLVALCARHRVSVRELLLWRAGGGMINAAVMGVVAPLRYILLTDALLDMLHREEVEAVMAHELGHVRRRHMFWLLAAAAGLLGLMELGVYAAMRLTPDVPPESVSANVAGWTVAWLGWPQVVLALSGGGAALGWVVLFGWVSRRFERQADTFAVQSLATQAVAPGGDAGDTVIDARSAETMIRALRQVALLNHIPVTRRSWRHGSIAWRQAHLRSLVGRRVGDVPIDRQMRWIKLGAAAAVIIVVLANVLL